MYKIEIVGNRVTTHNHEKKHIPWIGRARSYNGKDGTAKSGSIRRQNVLTFHPKKG
jgi:hypothetical protein